MTFFETNCEQALEDVDDAKDTFKYLKGKGVGEEDAVFYVEYAAFEYQCVNDIYKARILLKKGVDKGCQPSDLLATAVAAVESGEAPFSELFSRVAKLINEDKNLVGPHEQTPNRQTLGNVFLCAFFSLFNIFFSKKKTLRNISHINLTEKSINPPDSFRGLNSISGSNQNTMVHSHRNITSTDTIRTALSCSSHSSGSDGTTSHSMSKTLDHTTQPIRPEEILSRMNEFQLIHTPPVRSHVLPQVCCDDFILQKGFACNSRYKFVSSTET